MLLVIVRDEWRFVAVQYSVTKGSHDPHDINSLYHRNMLVVMTTLYVAMTTSVVSY